MLVKIVSVISAAVAFIVVAALAVSSIILVLDKDKYDRHRKN